MITLRLAVCAETVIRDAERNAVSVVNIIEEVRSPAFPVLVPRVTALFVLEREATDPERFNAELVAAYRGTERLRQAATLSFDGQLRMRWIFTLGPVPFESPGTFSIALHVDGSLLGTWDIPVSQVDAAARAVARLGGRKAEA